MKKFILFVVSLWCFAQQATAQQEQAALTHYHINPHLINPANAGLTDNHQVFLHGRNAWTGFPGGADTYALSYDGPIGKTFGLGAIIFSDKASYQNRFRAAVNYSFSFDVDDFNLGFGFSTEFSQLKLDNDVMNDPSLIDLNDGNLAAALDGSNFFGATLGFQGTYKGQTFMGIAFPNIIMARLDETPSSGGNEQEGFYLFNFGHRFISSTYGFTIEPSLLLRRAESVPFQADINLKGYFLEDKLIGGLSYRGGSNGALALLVGTRFSNFSFHYSFDVSFQQFQTYSSGAHEITLSVAFPGQRSTTN